jgi:hypothetical protein
MSKMDNTGFHKAKTEGAGWAILHRAEDVMERKVIACGGECRVEVREETSRSWTASGECCGESIVAHGATQGDTLLSWRDEALSVGHRQDERKRRRTRPAAQEKPGQCKARPAAASAND